MFSKRAHVSSLLAGMAMGLLVSTAEANPGTSPVSLPVVSMGTSLRLGSPEVGGAGSVTMSLMNGVLTLSANLGHGNPGPAIEATPMPVEPSAAGRIEKVLRNRWPGRVQVSGTSVLR